MFTHKPNTTPLPPVPKKERFANTRVDLSHRSVGPVHDPYQESTLTVTRYGVEYTLISCALAGTMYLVDKAVVLTAGIDYDIRDLEERFATDTGARPDQWEHWFYERIYVEDPMGSLSDYI